MLNKEVKMKYEIKSRATGKVVYEAEAKDAALDWNTKKKLLIIGRDDDKKLQKHIEKHGFYDFYLELVPEEVKAPKPKTKPKKVETEIIEPEIKKTPKKRSKKK
jgi:hypothetical protein